MEPKKFWEFKASADNAGELFLYGEIASYSWWGDEVTPKQFKADLDALGDVDTLRVYVNSPGGDVFAGWAIISILHRHKARKIGYNDALAASIAFDILMSMDEVIAMENSMFMAHNCWTYAAGNRVRLRELADQMEKIDGLRADAAAKRSGKTSEEVAAIMDAETWYTAQEALEQGFADSVQEGMKLAASIDGGFFVAGTSRFDLTRYKHPPQAVVVVEQAAEDKPAEPEMSEEPPVEPCDGGESQPVKDKDATQSALEAQRDKFRGIKRKLLGGTDNG